MNDSETDKEIYAKFSKDKLAYMLSETIKANIKLTKWLYDNYPRILKEYNDKEMHGMRIEFLNDKKDKITLLGGKV